MQYGALSCAEPTSDTRLPLQVFVKPLTLVQLVSGLLASVGASFALLTQVSAADRSCCSLRRAPGLCCGLTLLARLLPAMW